MSNTLLPEFVDREHFRALFPRDEIWRPAVIEICRRHRIAADPLVRAERGANILYFAGGKRVIKLIPPPARRKFAEAIVLAGVHGAIGVATPELVANGEIDGWAYLVMDCLPGVSIADCWSSVPRAERVRLLHAIGELMARLHALPIARFEGLETCGLEFIATQTRACVERQRKLGFREAWLSEIMPLLDTAALGDDVRSVLVCADIHHEHVLLEREGDRIRISGLIDFGDAFLGPRDYEFVTPGMWIARGEPELLRALALGYGLRAAELDARLSRRFMAWTLLHRFGDLVRLLAVLPQRVPRTTLFDVERELWSFE